MEARELTIKDLRVGNYIKHNGVGVKYFPDEIVEVDADFFSDVMNDWRGEHISNYEGIPLTEDWLIKFGFEDWGVVEINEYESYRRFVAYNVLDGTGNFEVHFITSTYGCRTSTQWVFSEDKDETINVKESEYVHNLQNVFYLYVGFELELKTEVNQ